VQLDGGFNLVPKDAWAGFSLKWNKWKLRMNPSSGLFTGSFDLFETVGSYADTKITATHHNVIGGVFIQPAPSAGIKGGGYGFVKYPPNPNFDAIDSMAITLTGP
jgi:hypothetical protein